MAGRDLQAGGTWLGVTAAGRCAVVTNVRDPQASLAGWSRGLLVSDYLTDSRGASAQAQTLLAKAASYRPFNLLLFDAQAALFLGNHPQPHGRALDPGVHALSNADLDTPWPKTCAIRQRLQAWVARAGDDPLPLLAALADEQIAADDKLPDTGIGLERERWLSSAFVRGERYGTRASTLVAIAHDGSGLLVDAALVPAAGPGPRPGWTSRRIHWRRAGSAGDTAGALSARSTPPGTYVTGRCLRLPGARAVRYVARNQSQRSAP